MLQREQIMRGKAHWPPKCVVRSPFSLFTCLATTQKRLVMSPRDPEVVSLHVNAGHFSTTTRRVTSPSWGPPPPCKQALNKVIRFGSCAHFCMRCSLFEAVRVKRVWKQAVRWRTASHVFERKLQNKWILKKPTTGTNWTSLFTVEPWFSFGNKH